MGAFSSRISESQVAPSRGGARLALGTILAAGLLAVGLAPAARAADWLPTFDLAGTSFVDLKMSPDGDIAIVTREGAEPFLRFRPAGGPLGAPEDDFPDGAEAPGIGIDAAGNIYLVWSRAGAIEARVRERDGSLGPVETIQAADGAGPAVSVSPGGVATFAWLTADVNRAVVARTRALDGGLGPAHEMSMSGEKTRDFDLDVDGDGDATFVWTTPEVPPNTKVKARILDFPGETLSAILDVSVPPAPELSDMAELAVDPAGNATLVWRHITASFNSLTETTSLSPTGVLGATQILTAPGLTSQSHAVAADDAGNARITWTETAGGAGDPYLPQTCIRAVTSSCGALTEVENSSALGTTVAMGGDGDAIVGLSDGRVRAFPRSGGPLAIHELSPTAMLPTLALDAPGDGIAVWTEGSAIKAAGYDAVAPRIDSVTVPAKGERGVPIPLSASVFDVWGATITWSFDQGGDAEGEDVKHRFKKTGTFQVRVTATDGAGASVSETREITIRDTRSPKLRLSGPRKRKLKRTVPVGAVCVNERCALVAKGKLIVRRGKHAKKSFRLRKATADKAARARTKLKPKLSKRGMKAAKRALRHGGKAKARIKVVATDGAGNATRKRRTVKLKH